MSSILPVSTALPAPFHEGGTPFLVLERSGQTELACECGLHTVFKMENVSAVLRTSQSQIFLQFCLKGPHQGFVLFSPRKLVAWPLPLSAVGMALFMPFPKCCPKCSRPPTPLLDVLGHRSQCVGPGFSFFWEKLQTALVSQATLWIDGGRTSCLEGTGLLCATSVAGRGRRGAP